MALTDLQLFAASRIHPAQIATRFKWRDWWFTTSQLPFNMQPQTQTQWCWAATATSTSIFYRSWSTWTQCSVACTTLGRNDCCNDPVPDECNTPWFLDQALTTTDNFVSWTGPVSYSAIQSEISAGRVLGARIGWSGGGGHFMVIYGCSTVDGVQYVNIDDPIYGKSNPTLTTFSSNYQGSGSWTHTYYTKAAPLVLKFPHYEISPLLLEKIWKVRPLLVPPEERARFDEAAIDEGVSFALAHPVHVAGLDQIAKGSPDFSRPAAIRIMETRGREVEAYYDVSPDPESAEVLQMASRDNDYAQLLERGLSVASKVSDERAAAQPKAAAGRKSTASVAPREQAMRLLRIPALYTEALILDAERGSQTAIVIRSPQPGVPLFTPMPIAELMRLLQAPARKILADDDGMKGS